MSVYQVAIVGRPNVGKSSLFNWLAGRRLAIVDDVAGVTRDRMTRMISDGDRYFEIVDTGGIGINDIDDLDEEIEYQIKVGMELADILLFMVDIREGVTSLDEQIARRIRTINKPTILVANKSDHDRLDKQGGDFFRLGMGEPLCVSAQNKRRKDELIESIFELIEEQPPREETAEDDEPTMKLAIVGRRNVGKSTFVNSLVDSPRMIVSEVAGTTRDSVDVHFEMDDHKFVAIDTPGLRKGKSVRTDIDFYGTHRAHRTVRFADVILMFFDAGQRVSKVDKKLCHYIQENHKPCILVVNKWDLMKDHMPTEQWAEYLREQFPSMANCPIAFITAMTGQNVKKLVNHAQMLFKQSRQRVSTSQLNRIVKMAATNHPPPLTSHHKRPKFFFATQIGVQPPTIVIKCNYPDSINKSYRRYLQGVFAETLPFGEVPIHLVIQERTAKEARLAKVQNHRALNEGDEISPPTRDTVPDVKTPPAESQSGDE